MKRNHIQALTLMALSWIPAQAGSQETVDSSLAADTPWFKIEVIVFQHRQRLENDDEVFTPRLVAQEPGTGEDGGIAPVFADPTIVSVEANERSMEFPDGSQAADNMAGSDIEPARNEGEPTMEPGDGYATTVEPEPEPTLEEKYFPPGSRFRLVDRIELFPEPVETSPEELQEPGDEPLDGGLAPDPFQEPAPGTGLPSLDDGTYIPPEEPRSEEEIALLATLSTLDLSDHANQIQRRDAYRLLAHMAWIQPGYDSEQAVQFPLAALAGSRSGLNGGLTLIMTRYLHMQFDLGLDESLLVQSEDTQESLAETPGGLEALLSLPGIAPDTGAQLPLPIYHIGEKRRMRSGELHYIDHPRFGVLTRVTPVNPAALALLESADGIGRALPPGQP